MISELSCQVLQAGLDDWVPFAAVVGLARRLEAISELEAIDQGVAAIRELASHGYLAIGDVSDGGFFQWDGSLEDALLRAERTCRRLHQDDWGFAGWLQNTSDGDAQARGPASEY